MIAQLDSFDQLNNHVSANYFASGLLIPEEEILREIRAIFCGAEWNPSAFTQMLEKFSVPPESVFHRLTQILPKNLDLQHLFFLRYEFDTRRNRYEISRELHLSNPHGPHRVQGDDHYCSRWLIHRLTQQQQRTGQAFQLGIQRSHYQGTENEYLILGATFPKPLSSRTVTSICLGLLVNEELKKSVTWLNSDSIPRTTVGETCQTCSVENCRERTAALDPAQDPGRVDRVFKAIAALDG